MDDISRLLDEINALNDALPPVEAWHPDRTITVDIRIDRNGHWFHEGGEISRRSMVRLFSSILRKDVDGYCLVTPVERCLIAVDDVPFVAHIEFIESVRGAQRVFLRTQADDVFCIGREHALEMRETESGFVPYVHVRNGLYARMERSSYYQIVDYLECIDGDLYLKSDGMSFPMR